MDTQTQESDSQGHELLITIPGCFNCVSGAI